MTDLTTTDLTALDLFERHRDRLERAVSACRTRGAWSPFVESPSRRHHPPGAPAAGKARFDARLGRPFEMDLPGVVGRVGAETSPYTGAPLGVDYPAVDPDALYAGVHRAWPAWRRAAPAARVGVCMEILDRWAGAAFENAHATMHTAGQGFMLGFAGSGASSLDRGLEALAHAHLAMSMIPAQADYSRRFGRGDPARLIKRYRLIPVGIAVVISCGSYPAWNAYPAILANLATGNPVVLKPHPQTILPMAIAVEIGRAALADAGFDPDLLTLAADTWDDPITKRLVLRPDTAIVDFTGGQRFGAWLEANCKAQVYTETAGCNAVVLESAPDLGAALGAIAHGLTLFSAQMCTAPQNIWIPRQGVRDGDRLVPADAVADRLAAAVDALVADPARAAGLCGAIHSPVTIEEIDQLRDAAVQAGGRVIRDSAPYAHPEHPSARTATPLIVAADPADRALRGREWFGPMALVLQAPDRGAALAMAAADTRAHGAIANYAYTADPGYAERVEDAFLSAGASVGVNLIRQRPMNFTAAFSDFHVTGLNPAGNACLTDLAFVTRRFRVAQCKVELPDPEPRPDPET